MNVHRCYQQFYKIFKFSLALKIWYFEARISHILLMVRLHGWEVRQEVEITKFKVEPHHNSPKTLEEALLHFLMSQSQVRKAGEAAEAWKVHVPSQDDISHHTQCFCPERNQTMTKDQHCLGSVLAIFKVKVLKKFLEIPLNIL